MHAKWSPTSRVTFYPIPKITNICNPCPKKVFTIKEENIIFNDIEDCDYCGECGNVEESKRRIVTIESSGNLSSRKILKLSIDTLKKKCINILKDVQKLIIL